MLLSVGLPFSESARPREKRAGRSAAAPVPSRGSHQNSAALARLRREFLRASHSQESEQIKAGLLGLLMLCANATDARHKVELSLDAIERRMRAAARRPHAALRAFGARPLRCAEAPSLYAILLEICHRAGLRRVPELYLLPFAGMNAYALGGPDNACISVTEDLLRGLSRQEISGIFAHEVAHVLHHDDHAMNWAVAVQHAITETSARRGHTSPLLAAAPLMARLLTSALSRVRELAADARAIDLIESPGALVDALCKLEFFHTGFWPRQTQMRGPSMARALHSHPETWERIARLR